MSTDYTIDSTQTTSTSQGIGLDKDYLRSIPGLLKIAEIVLVFVAFICASVDIWWGSYGGGWVQFVTMSAFITTLVFFLFHLLRVIGRLPGPWILIEFIYYCVYTLMLLISFIVAAARAGYFYHNSSIIATAIFTFIATAVYAVDTFFQFKNWRSSREAPAGATTTTTTTATHTTYETKTQY